MVPPPLGVRPEGGSECGGSRCRRSPLLPPPLPDATAAVASVAAPPPSPDAAVAPDVAATPPCSLARCSSHASLLPRWMQQPRRLPGWMQQLRHRPCRMQQPRRRHFFPATCSSPARVACRGGLEVAVEVRHPARGGKRRMCRQPSRWAPIMAAEWWWFLVVNAVVAAIAVLSSRARPPLALASPRRGAGEITRRASSAVLQRLRSFSIFSFPSACFHTAPFLQPAAAAAVSQETEEPVASPIKSPAPAIALPSPPAAERATAAEEDEEDDPDAMSMEEAYALALAGQRRPEREREEETRQSEVDAKAEEFIQGFKEDQRQQRLNSIFNYTQMLKQRALGAGGRQPDARSDQL